MGKSDSRKFGTNTLLLPYPWDRSLGPVGGCVCDAIDVSGSALFHFVH